MSRDSSKQKKRLAQVGVIEQVSPIIVSSDAIGNVIYNEHLIEVKVKIKEYDEKTKSIIDSYITCSWPNLPGIQGWTTTTREILKKKTERPSSHIIHNLEI
jgi:hypothetical protein